MIILAAAIILSISNSGIMDKANKAKEDSDTANLKEYVNVLEAEWELGTKETSGKTKTAYVNEKLVEKYQDKTYSADGEIYTNVTETAKETIISGLKVGDIVEGYTVQEKSTNTSGKENTAPFGTEKGNNVQTISSKTDFVWRYVGISEDGNIMIKPDITSDTPSIKLSGMGSYLHGAEELKIICDTLYSTTKGKARGIKVKDIVKILGYTGITAGYIDDNWNIVPTNNTIGELEEKFGMFEKRQTPEDKLLEEYSPTWFQIASTRTEEFKFPNRVNVISNGAAYWVADNCIYVSFKENYVGFFVFSITSNGWLVAGCGCTNTGASNYSTVCVCPIVELYSDVSMSYNSITNTLILN